MKKIICLLLSFILAGSYLPLNANAKETENKATEVIYYEDGSSISVELVVSTDYTRALIPKTATKIIRYRNSDGVEEWNAALEGTFAYDGTYSTCSASKLRISITNSAWTIISKSETTSGNSAIGDVTMGRKTLGIITERVNKHIVLTCDQFGNIS